MQERHALAQVRRALLDAPTRLPKIVRLRARRACLPAGAGRRVPPGETVPAVYFSMPSTGVRASEQQRGKDVARDAHHAKDPSPPEAIDEQAPDEVRGGYAGGEAELLTPALARSPGPYMMAMRDCAAGVHPASPRPMPTRRTHSWKVFRGAR